MNWKNAPRSKQPRRRYLSEREHKRIKYIVSCDYSMADVARLYGISYWTVRDIVYGRRKPRNGPLSQRQRKQA